MFHCMFYFTCDRSLSDLNDLEVLHGLNGDVELDEAIGRSWTQLLAVYTPRGTNDSCLLFYTEPEVAAARTSATTFCICFTKIHTQNFIHRKMIAEIKRT